MAPLNYGTNMKLYVNNIKFKSNLMLMQPLVKFKSHFYFEEKDNLTLAEKSLQPLKGSTVLQFLTH